MTKIISLTALAQPAAASMKEIHPMHRVAPVAAPTAYLREFSACPIITSDLRIAHLVLSDGRAATALPHRGADDAVGLVEIFADHPPAWRARRASWAHKDERIGDTDLASLRPVLAHLLAARELTPADRPPVEERVLAWTDWISRGETRIEAIIALRSGADRQMAGKLVLQGKARDVELDLVLRPTIDPAHGVAFDLGIIDCAFSLCPAWHDPAPLHLLLDPAVKEPVRPVRTIILPRTPWP